MHPHHPPYSTHTRSRTPSNPNPLPPYTRHTPKYSCLQVCCQSINLKMAIRAETCSLYLCNKQHICNHQIVVFDIWLIQLQFCYNHHKNPNGLHLMDIPTHFSCSAALHTTQNVSTYLLHHRTIWCHNIYTSLQTADISLQHRESQTRLIFCLILCYRCLWDATMLCVQRVQTASKGKIH